MSEMQAVVPSASFRSLRTIKLAARISLGLVWIYEGIVPKILFVRTHPDQIAMVERSGWYWGSPEWTLAMLGIAQVIVGIALVMGWCERAMVLVATLAMLLLIVLVASTKPAMLTEPFGALVKDLCLIACAWTVWVLAPLRAGETRLGRD